MTIQFNPLSKVVKVGGNTFEVTALPLGIMRRLVMPIANRFNESGMQLDDEVITVMLKTIHASVGKADPEITVDMLENNLLLTDISELFTEVMSVSGMTRENTTGEASSPQILSSNGETSTGLSQPQPDGLIAT